MTSSSSPSDQCATSVKRPRCRRRARGTRARGRRTPAAKHRNRHTLAIEPPHDELVIGRRLERAGHEHDLPAGKRALREHRNLRQKGRDQQPLIRWNASRRVVEEGTHLAGRRRWHEPPGPRPLHLAHQRGHALRDAADSGEDAGPIELLRKLPITAAYLIVIDQRRDAERREPRATPDAAAVSTPGGPATPSAARARRWHRAAARRVDRG